ncbi:hypothetical protein ACJ72_04628 [Emergomyces africanus]|uniref:G-protein coupled receptors family 1 profile domain-containing protein n=1 Tax=Emergomyces africanus TaxID=1955775 RepID=A0A1B7NW92_9EURO|nr:hypothetical protein ACJ72_04628 [Emergomyces africanus]
MSAVELQRRNGAPLRIISPIPHENRIGMIVLFTCSLMSVMATGSLLVWLTYRLVYWRRFYTRYPGHNQFVVLIFNLLLADLHQATANMVSPYWLHMDKMSAYSPLCFAQGWLFNFGNISSALFVLTIAAHTFANVVTRKTLRHEVFVGCVIALWIFCVILTLLAPVLRGRYIFAPTGAWCWISNEFRNERLYLHYLWIFIAQIGIIIIYPTLYFIIRRRLAASKEFRGINDSSRPKFNKVLKTMILYPIAYIALSLPIAAGRTALMNYKDPGMPYFYAMGSLLVCSGWVDSLLYFLTRRRLLEADIQTETESTSNQNYNHSSGALRTIGGGIRGVDSRHKHNSAPLKNPRAPQTASSSTDHIIDGVELSDLGQVKKTTVIEISSATAGAASSPSSSSSTHLPPMDPVSPTVPHITLSDASTQPHKTKKWSLKYETRWAS